MPPFETLPYRPCVGAVIFNRNRHVFVGRRKGGPEHVDITHVWQMPQGGIDDGEDPDKAVLREIYEETSIRSLKQRGKIEDWLFYDLPPKVAGEAWGGKYRGQTQKWYAFDFTGNDSEIDILSPGGGKHKPEFVAWRWEPLVNLPGLIIQFKRAVYDRVVRDFAHLAKD